PDLSFAEAVNRGLEESDAEVLGWLAPGDMLSVGALLEVGRAFDDDPELEMVYGNAIFLDARNRPHLADRGPDRNGFWLARYEQPDPDQARLPVCFDVPPPTVFFRRRLLERHGALDPRYRHLAAFDLFVRFATGGTGAAPGDGARLRKLERTQAIC